ncbi:hypothetical protein J5N97_001302 [Dioscorea zingiberensis]|uniref:Uncharacterized protein n=1 Tax=Dioscorea zingiberensis TaxID=325984 RepID=A0A9D5BU84_9LILI|nr:hypothetical protein J5N97_001302 [Dioscorea zingiberensis]
MAGILARVFRSSAQRGITGARASALVRNCADFSRSDKMMQNGHDHATRVLFCGFEFPASHIYTQQYLETYPFIKVDVVARDDVPNVIDKYPVCVVKMCQLNSEVIARATQMKLIMQFGVGLEGVNIPAATSHNIKVARIPGQSCGNSSSCAEMAIYLMLGLLRKKKEMEASVKQKRLGEPIGDTLMGKTVFIMGFGAIGKDLAKRLHAFGVKIIATKRSWPAGLLQQHGSTDDDISGLVDKKGTLEDNYEFAAEADIVLPCLTLNSETDGIINEQFLSSMKKGSLLVNVARGRLLHYDSVYRSLKSGHLGGLAIDVAWQEPFNSEDPILQFPNVIITPHVAGVTECAYRTMAKIVEQYDHFECAVTVHPAGYAWRV